MKNNLLLLAFALITFFAKAQDSTITLSRFERMATSPGRFFKFEEVPIGTVKSQNVSVIKIRSFNANDSSAVVRIASNFWDNTPIIGNSVLYLEKEDIDAVIKMLEYYSNQIRNNEAVARNYFSYITSNDIQILCKYEERVWANSYLTINKVYQSLRTPVANSAVYFTNKKDIDRLIVILKDASKEI